MHAHHKERHPRCLRRKNNAAPWPVCAPGCGARLAPEVERALYLSKLVARLVRAVVAPGGSRSVFTCEMRNPKSHHTAHFRSEH